jgi:uncharacterized membrane protein YecN with MAPEG domain
MTKEQKIVLIGMIGAATFSAVFFEFAFRATALDLLLVKDLEAGDRLAYAVRCDVIAALCMLAGVAMIANRRFLLPEAIGGGRAASLEVDLRYLTNTTEQLVLAVIAHLALSVELPAGSLRAIPILVVLFVIGRIAFWIGYRISPVGRAFGFATTFYPTVAAYGYVLLRMTS